MNRQEQIERMIALCEAATHGKRLVIKRGGMGYDVVVTDTENDDDWFPINGNRGMFEREEDARYEAAHSPSLVADLWRVVAAADSVRQHGDIESGRMMTDALDALWQRMEERGE